MIFSHRSIAFNVRATLCIVRLLKWFVKNTRIFELTWYCRRETRLKFVLRCIVLLIIMSSEQQPLRQQHTEYLLNIYEHALEHANGVRIAIILLVYEHQVRALYSLFRLVHLFYWLEKERVRERAREREGKKNLKYKINCEKMEYIGKHASFFGNKCIFASTHFFSFIWFFQTFFASFDFCAPIKDFRDFLIDTIPIFPFLLFSVLVSFPIFFFEYFNELRYSMQFIR